MSAVFVRMVPGFMGVGSWVTVVACGALVVACAEIHPPALAWSDAPDDSAPVVQHDLTVRPFPEVPFPNDLATRVDPTSPTGRRLNVSLIGETLLESEAREQLAHLDGWGTTMPITVSFTAPLDLDELQRRHGDNFDFADDAIYVVRVDEGPEYGEPVMLDMGRGNFPATIKPGTEYFPSDPRFGGSSLLFESVHEDTNGNGRLDAGEDTDGDGVLDIANVWPPNAAPWDVMGHYDVATHTLSIRPVVALREQARYAVVLTKRLVGSGGRGVRSPFPIVHHASQYAALRPLEAIIEGWRREKGWNIAVDDIAFAWVFTTRTVTAPLVRLREGLNGYGPLGWLGHRVPADAVPTLARTPPTPESPAVGEPYILDVKTLRTLVRTVLAPAFGLSDAQRDGLLADYEHVAYLAQGELLSPDFIDPGEPFMTPSDPDDPQSPWVVPPVCPPGVEPGQARCGIDPSRFDIYANRFDWDPEQGRARMHPARIPFIAVIPKATARYKPPFPVAIYSHGFGQARVEPLGFAGILARYGIASIGIDTYGHGLRLRPKDRAAFADLADLLGFRPFADMMLVGRGRDLDGDGLVDAGGDMWSAHAGHTRDALMQTYADTLQLVRVLKGFDGQRRWKASFAGPAAHRSDGVDVNGDGTADLAGDFDGDGVVDLGGPDTPIYLWGSSMGGLITNVLGAVEPGIRLTAPVSGGACLTCLTARSRQVSVLTDTVMRGVGPMVVGEPLMDDPGAMEVSFVGPFMGKLRRLPIGRMEAPALGMEVHVANLDKATHRSAPMRFDAGLHPTDPTLPPVTGWRFAVPLAADKGDRFTVEVRQGYRIVQHFDRWATDVRFDSAPEPTFRAGDPLRAPVEGLGAGRGAPRLRQIFQVAQTLLEPVDGANFARHWFREPLAVRPEGPAPTHALVLATLGDPANPSDIHPLWARAAGILPYREPSERFPPTVNDWLARHSVFEGWCDVGRFPLRPDGTDELFDPDALDRLAEERGLLGNGFDAHKPPPGSELRITTSAPPGAPRSAMRFAHMKPCGSHSFFITNPDHPFNIDAYLASLVGHYFRSEGKVVLDDACHATGDCPLP